MKTIALGFFLLTSLFGNFTTSLKSVFVDTQYSLFSAQQEYAIYIHLEYTYGLGVQLNYRPYLLFRDGSIYKNLDVNPEDFQVSSSKKNEPNEWGSWKKQGDEFHIKWNNGKDAVWKKGNWFTTVAPKNGELLAGNYKSLSGLTNMYVGGDATVLSVKNLSFDGNKFTYDAKGSSSSSTLTAYGSSSQAGTYKLGNNIIELNFNNGKTEKKFFFFTPDSKRVFGVGSTYYIEKKN